ncbi:MAG: hypothetical protein WD276_00710, partial [Actinomycetota bacterium]
MRTESSRRSRVFAGVFALTVAAAGVLLLIRSFPIRGSDAYDAIARSTPAPSALPVRPHLVATIELIPPAEQGSENVVTAVTAGEGGFWAAVQHRGSPDVVVRIDPQTDRVTATTEVLPYPWHMAAGAGGVWVTGVADDQPALQRFDPATGAVISRIEFPED